MNASPATRTVVSLRPWTSVAQDAYDRRVQRANEVNAARARLVKQLQDALMHDPQRVVDAPGFGRDMTAADIVADDFAAAGDTSLHDLLRILGDAATGQDVALRAQMWISVAACRHGEFHAADAADRGDE